MKKHNALGKSLGKSSRVTVGLDTFSKYKKGRSLAASVVLALYGYETMAMPFAAAAARVDVQERGVKVAVEKTYLLYVPQGETVSQVAHRFAVSEAALTTLHTQMAALGWSDKVWLVPQEKTGSSEAALYPGYVFYTLRKGESLASVALQSNRSQRELTRLNALMMGEKGVAGLKAGDTIIKPVPKAKGAKADSATEENSREFEQRLAQTLSQLGQGLYSAQESDSGRGAGDVFAQQAASGASSALSQQAEELLSPYGRAKISVQANIETNDVNLALDYLHPLLEGHDDILFGQVAVRQFDERNIGNIGLGYRKQVNDELMLGINAFVDQDFSRSHTRGGLGMEVWTEQARLSANAYAPISGWKKSDQDRLNPDTERYDLYERPASGWDARVEIALPGAPKVAGTAKYFQWKGEGVDTFGGGKLERDPKGYSLGVKWQPVPLVGFNAEHEQITGGDGQFKVGMNLTWSFDRPLSSQFEPGSSAALRPLADARKDFVSREYNVVLDYKKEEKVATVPFAFVEPTMSLTAPSGRAASPLVSPSPALQGVDPAGQVKYEKGAVTLVETTATFKANKLQVTVDPVSGYVTIPAGITARSVEVFAHQEVNGRSTTTASYKLIVAEPVDTDGEGLTDDEEAIYGTDPAKPDTDGDGWTDREEVDAGTDPRDPNIYPGRGKPIIDVTDIKGVLQVGQTLTGAYSFNANGGNGTDASVMTWKNGGHADGDASYVLDASDVGRVLTFEVQAKNGANEVGNTDSLSTASAPGVSGGGTTPPGSIIDPVAGAPIVDVTDIKGVLQVGQTLTGAYSFNANGGNGTDASVMTWKNGGHADGDASYVLDAGDVGRVLTFEVQAKNGANVVGNTDSLSTASAPGVSGGGTTPPGSIIDPVAGAPIVDVTDIKGVLQVGQTLTGAYSFNANGGNGTDASVMTWKNGGHADGDASYVLDAGDVGRVLTFEVQAKNGANVVGNTDSLSTASAPGVSGGGTTPPGSIIDPVAGAPIVDVTDIKGVLQVGQTLTGVYSFDAHGGNGTDASVMTWKNGGHADGDVNYVLDAGDVGRVLIFEVQAKNGANVVGNTDSLSTASAPGVSGGGTTPPGSIIDPVAAPIVDVTDIKGVLQVGQTLTGVYSFDAHGGNGTDASVMTWKNGGHADGDANYVLDAGDVGRVLIFEVQAKNGANVVGNTDILSTIRAPGVSGGGTTPPGSIIDPVAAPIVDVTDIKGVLQVGQTLTGVYSFDAHGGNGTDASVMTWKNGGHADGDANYVLDAGDVGRVLIFEVQAKNGANVVGNTDTLSTASAPGVSGGGTTPPGSIIDPVAPLTVLIDGFVNGYPQVGSPLTSRVTCVATCAPGLTYRWEIEKAVGGGDYQVIPGATNDSYTPVKEDQRRMIRLIVSNP
ncbi:inverse autotransporter beta domain-containing protein [Pseudomonas sp. P154a]|uniref:ZirU family protein n=1 Tax=Pseudomonas mucoides TaxID=2730424 RepID=UPI0018925313|nr:ZirU family protein [Pseudomonas mucoides]MBF6037329.1 inverse autotransporter beta domain-containing protein [Pseudomonas mucoides]